MQNDPYKRSRHQSQAYSVSTFGKPLETAQSGYGKRLAGSPLYAIPIKLKGGVATKQVIGDLTAGLWVKGVVLHRANAGTIQLELEPTDAGGDGVVLQAALDATTAAETAISAQLLPLPVDRVLTATLTGSTADTEVLLSLIVCPVTEHWG